MQPIANPSAIVSASRRGEMPCRNHWVASNFTGFEKRRIGKVTATSYYD
jgi:hypothetical protein